MNVKKTKSEDIVKSEEGQYVSRGGLKLASVAKIFNLDLRNKTILDVGSSTGGFTDYALQHGADRVIAVDSGKQQLHPSLRTNPKIELHEQTDIRSIQTIKNRIHYVFIDVSFISIREVLLHLPNIIGQKTEIIAMVKPQFEVLSSSFKHKGIIKNEAMRRKILRDFETWAASRYQIINKADSQVLGDKGNRERFYQLVLLTHEYRKNT